MMQNCRLIKEQYISPSQCGQAGCQLVTMHSADCCLCPIPSNKLLVFDSLSAPTSKESKFKRKRKARKPHLAAVSVNMTSRGRNLTRSRRGKRQVSCTLS